MLHLPTIEKTITETLLLSYPLELNTKIGNEYGFEETQIVLKNENNTFTGSMVRTQESKVKCGFKFVVPIKKGIFFENMIIGIEPLKMFCNFKIIGNLTYATLENHLKNCFCSHLYREIGNPCIDHFVYCPPSFVLTTNMKYKETCCNFMLIVENKHNPIVHFMVEKDILRGSSTFFVKVIDVEKRKFLKITDVDSKSVESLLDFIYFQKKEIDLSWIVQDVIKLASLYNLNDLVLHCKISLINFLKDRVMLNLVEILKLVTEDLYELEKVKQELFSYITNKGAKFIKDKQLLDYISNEICLKNYCYLFQLVMENDVEEDITLSVKLFYKKNQKLLVSDKNFRDLLLKHPQWSLKMLEFFSENCTM